jgi:pyrimidine operon attenuation protein/uracil phosphoribosyltransferase
MPTDSPARDRAREILDADALARTLARLAHELIERNDELQRLALVGIHSRGVPLAQRLRGLVAERSGVEPDLGSVDISFHRDDVLVRGRSAPRHAHPVVRGTELGFSLEGRTCVLVDDVLFTGRTVRAALDALMDLGRPRQIQLAVLIDRGHRELPVKADFVGKNLPTARSELVEVRLVETDGDDEVVIVKSGEDRDAREEERP